MLQACRSAFTGLRAMILRFPNAMIDDRQGRIMEETSFINDLNHLFNLFAYFIFSGYLRDKLNYKIRKSRAAVHVHSISRDKKENKV